MVRLTFTGGTLVLDDCPGALAAELPGLRWDPRVGAHRAPARHYQAIRAALARTQLAHDDRVLLPSSAGSWTPPELRSYQQAALLAWHGAGKRGLAILPTGSGKTRLACAAMASTQAASLCLVPTRVLLHQWRQEISAHYQGPIGCLGDGAQQLEHVTVATFEGAYRHMARIGHRFGLLIVDEAHHFGSGARDEALEMCAAPARLGLTATAPPAPQLAQLTELVGPVVCELRIGDLAGQWLADFDTAVLLLRLTPEERKLYAASVATFRSAFEPFIAACPGARWMDFVTAAQRTPAGRAALAAYRQSRRLTSYPLAKRAAVAELLARHQQARTLVFTSSNEAAYAVAREHLVMPITCDIDRKERDRALARFRAGELRVLVSARVLNEGLDVPDAEVAIIVGGVSGEREHVQRVGRLLRPAPGKRALVYELIAADTHEVRKAAERRRGLARTSR